MIAKKAGTDGLLFLYLETVKKNAGQLSYPASE